MNSLGSDFMIALVGALTSGALVGAFLGLCLIWLSHQ
jgi:hypothetical protein